MERIVVGIDGSQASRTALRWAVAEARVHHATVEAWHAWYVVDDGDGMPPDPVAAESAARALLDKELDGMDGVRRVLIRALAASALLDASRSADLLVLGAEPGPGFGAVTGRVVAHAGCPVVLVPWLAGSR